MFRIQPQFALAAVMALVTLTPASAGLLESEAPDFALRSTTGETLRLSEFRSDVVLLTFTADWCARCRQALPTFDTLYRELQASGLEVLAVDVGGQPSAAAAQAADLQLGFALLVDSGQDVSRLYTPRQLPMTVLIDRAGRVRHIDQGFGRDSAERISTTLRQLLNE